MTRPIWKDCTSYSDTDRKRVPKTLEIVSGSLRIVVNGNHIRHKGRWVMSCYRLGIDVTPLDVGITQEQAQRQALKIVENCLATFQQDFNAIP